MPIKPSENAKEVLYPAKVNTWMNIDDDPAKELYKKTHGNYDPGEQKKRDYQWPVNKD